MFLGGTFTKLLGSDENIIIDRKGLANRVVVPSYLIGRNSDIDVKESDLVVGEGNTVYIATDEFGVIDNGEWVEINLLFIEGGMLFELFSGEVMLRGKDGNFFVVNASGFVKQVDKDLLGVTNWVKTSEMFDTSMSMVKSKFGLLNNTLAEKYTNNLVINIHLNFDVNHANDKGIVGPLMTMRFVDYYTDISRGYISVVSDEVEFDDENALEPYDPDKDVELLDDEGVDEEFVFMDESSADED